MIGGPGPGAVRDRSHISKKSIHSMQQQQQQQSSHDVAGGGGSNSGKSATTSSDAHTNRAKWLLVSGTPKKPTVMPPPSYISPKKQMHVDSLNKRLAEGGQIDGKVEETDGGVGNQMHVTFDPHMLLQEENKVDIPSRPSTGGAKGGSTRGRKKKVIPLSASTPDQLLKEVARRMISKVGIRNSFTSLGSPDAPLNGGGGGGSNGAFYNGRGVSFPYNNNDNNNHGTSQDISPMMDEAANYTMWLNDITESYRLRAALVLGELPCLIPLSFTPT